MEGAGAVGIAANIGTIHKVAQKDGLKLAKKIRKTSTNISFDTIVNLPQLKDSEGNIILGGYKNASGEYIATILSEIVSATVDNSKESTLGKINFGTSTLNTAAFLIQIGVPREYAVYFMNQPIIREYIALQEVNESMTAEEFYFEGKDKRFDKLNKTQILQTLSTKYGFKGEIDDFNKLIYSTNGTHTIEELKKIEGKKPSDKQVQFLAEFIRYQELAKINSDLIKATKYDTNAYGKNIHELQVMLQRSQDLLKSGDIINADKLFDSGFIAPYYKSALSIGRIYKESFFTTFNNPKINDAYQYVMDLGMQLNLSNEDLGDLLNKFTKTIISTNILAMPSGMTVDSTGTNVDINTIGKLLMNYPKQFLDTLKSMKDDKRFINNPLLQDLQIFDRKVLGQLSNIKLKSDQRDKNITDEYIEAVEEIMDAEPKFGKRLLYFLMKQNGYQNSPLDMRRILPTYRFHTETYDNPVLNQFIPTLLKQLSNTTDVKQMLIDFFANNHDATKLVPKVKANLKEFVGDKRLQSYIANETSPLVPFYKK